MRFDLNCRGEAELLGWTTAGTDEGFLVFDRDGDGMITCGAEMFGNFTPLSWTRDGPKAANGFAALEWFDRNEQGGNGDGWITTTDAVWSRLGIWIDANHNGVTEPGELQTLDEAGITSISVAAHESRRQDRFGNEFRFRGWAGMMHRGRQVLREIFDVFLVHG